MSLRPSPSYLPPRIGLLDEARCADCAEVVVGAHSCSGAHVPGGISELFRAVFRWRRRGEIRRLAGGR